jgi:TRAP transporter 4TM/12TM fusion protein
MTLPTSGTVTDNIGESKFLSYFITSFSMGLFLFLASYGILLWDSDHHLVTIYVPACLILWATLCIRDHKLVPSNKMVNLVLCLLIIVISAIIAAYFYLNYRVLVGPRLGNNNFVDILLGGVALFLILLATFKTAGFSIPVVFFTFAIYSLFAIHFPGILKAPNLSLVRFVQLTATGVEGIFGMFPRTVFTMVIMFMFFAGLLRGFGGLNFLINFSTRIFCKTPWGLAQSPVIASMLFGSFSGAAPANVAGTGSFTIPMMIRFGVPPHIAGAIESVASTGGQIMPPVMGVAAFVMASLLNVPFARIVIIAFAPALLFYIVTAYSVYLITKKMPISNLPPEMRREILSKDFHMIDGLPMAIALCCLCFLLIYWRFSVSIAALYTVGIFLCVELLLSFKREKISFITLKNYASKLLIGIRDGASSVAGLMILLCTMGAIAQLIVATGLSQTLSFLMVDLSGEHMFLLLFLTFIICMLFGLATTTLVAYLLVVLLAAPALFEFGVPLIIGHFIVFYMAIVSAITPPIAVAAAVASSIAGASFFKTAFNSMRIGITLFVLPFVFFFNQKLLDGKLVSTSYAFFEVVVPLLAIAYALCSTSNKIKEYANRTLFGVLGVICLTSGYDQIKWIFIGSILALSAIYFFHSKKKTESATELKEKITILYDL